ncbi:MAG: ATP-binding cassette domain-containing protein [Acidimicrobiales bacterium]
MTDTSTTFGAPSTAPPPGTDVVLQVKNISKSFGPVVALRDINLYLKRGEVLGLVGDNGAGKSTLVKIICGFHQPDTGEILLEGQRVTFHSVQDARRHGIDTVYQDLALVPQLPIYANLFLGREETVGGPLRMLSKHKMRKASREYLDAIKVHVPSIDAEVEQLSGGQRQAVAVARATRSQVKVLLLDEPLAAMGAKESALIIDLVKDLASRGQSMIVIDHNYTHLFELCDRLAVVQDGVISFEKATADITLEELTDYMVSEYRKEVEAGRTAVKRL